MTTPKYLFVGSAPGFQVFSIAADGALAIVAKSSATGGIGIDINRVGTLGYGAISLNANARVAGCSIGTNGVPVLLPGSPFSGSGGSQADSTAVLLSADEKFLFVSNPGSSLYPPVYTMTVFAVDGAGGLTQSSTVAYQSGHDGRQIGLATNAAGTLLFAAELSRGSVDNAVGVYNVAANGVLTEVAGSPFPTGVTSLSGLESLAVYEPSPATNGSVIINAQPDAMNATAPWTLTGPNSYNQSGMGDQTLNNLPVGNYTITWGDVSGWIKPSPATETKALTSGGTITFSGMYVQLPIIIQVTQSVLNFGYVPPGSYKDLILVVKNIGGGY